MANLYTNKFGARVVSCDAHEAESLRHVYGDPVKSGETDQECPKCRSRREWDEAPAHMRAALMSPRLSHTRYRYGSVYAYHRDPTSPSGVMLASGLDPERYEKLIAEMRESGTYTGHAAPLSPTEGLCAPSKGRW